MNYSRRALLFPYRRVFRRTARQGHAGIIEPFYQVDRQKESLRTRRFGGRYSHYFAGGFVPRRRRNSTRRYSAAPKREFRNQLPLFSLDCSSSTVPSFRFRPLLRASHQLRPRGVIAGGLRADRKTSSKPGTRHSEGGKIYRYQIPNHVLTMGAYPSTKMMAIPTGSTYFM